MLYTKVDLKKDGYIIFIITILKSDYINNIDHILSLVVNPHQ